MSWLLLTFVSATFRAIYGVMTKVLSNKLKVSVYTQATLLPFAAAFIALLISPLLGGIQWSNDASLLAICLVILGQGLGNIVYFAAIKSLTNGTAQIAFSSILVFNTLLSVFFLGLDLTPINYLGVMLLMVAILSVTTGKIELNPKGILLMIFAAMLFSVFQLASSVLSGQVSSASYLLISYFGAAMVVFALKFNVVVDDLKNNWEKSTLRIPILTAIPSLGNFYFAYLAYRVAPEPPKVAMLLTGQVVLTVIISYFALKEKGHIWRKLGAASLVLLAAILIKSN